MNPALQHVERASKSEETLHQRSLRRPGTPLHTILLACGIASSVLYIAADIIGAIRYAGYSYVDHTFSELMASGSPVRPLMIALCSIPYTMLMTAFVAGVWNSSGLKRTARITAALLAGYAGVGLVAGIAFPMNTRIALAAGEAGLRNAMHPVGTAVMSLILLLAMGFGATLLGRRFRYYTYITIGALLVFGILTSLQAGDMVHNLPTPWMGIEERVNIYATMSWMAILAVGLLRVGAERPSDVRL